jgi:Predicted membrane-associated Zn-dependent proteases 1
VIIYSIVHLIHREKHREIHSVETKMKISYVSFLILFELTGTARALVSTKTSSSSGITSGSSRCSSFITSRHSNRSFHPNNIGKSTRILRINDNKAAFPNNHCHHHHHRNVTPLQALPAAAVAATAPIGSLSVLAFIILVHEAGHFLAARSFGIKVKEFSVGVGPKVFGFVQGGGGDEEETGQDAKENNDGIEFNLRAIPFGGYVRFPENYNATLEYQLEQEAEDKRKQIEEKVKEIRNSEEGKTSAGLLSTIGSGFFNMPKSSTEEERRQALQMIASELKVQGRGQELGSNVSDMVPWWKTLFAASSNKNKQQEEKESRSIVIEQDGTVTVPPVEYYNDPDLLQNRSWVQRGIVLVGGVVFNIILAFLLYFGELTVGSGLPKPVFGQGAVVNSVARANSASVGLLDKGDIILALNGKFYVPFCLLGLLPVQLDVRNVTNVNLI